MAGESRDTAYKKPGFLGKAGLLIACTLVALLSEPLAAQQRTSVPVPLRREFGSSFKGTSVPDPWSARDTARFESPRVRLEEPEPVRETTAAASPAPSDVQTVSYSRFPYSYTPRGYRYPYGYRYYWYQPRVYPFGVGPYTYNYGGYSANPYSPYFGGYGYGFQGLGLYAPYLWGNSPYLWGSNFGAFPGFGYAWGPYTGYSLYYGFGPYTATYSLQYQSQFPGYGYGVWSGLGDGLGAFCDPYMW